MATCYKIPLQFQAGRYRLDALPADCADALTLTLGACDILSYNTPNDGIEVRLYSKIGFMLTEQLLQEGLCATYSDDGMLKYVEVTQGEAVRLVYIGYRDDEDARAEILDFAEQRAEILDFAEQSAEIISNELLCLNKKAARLFIEYFYDGEGVDFAVKLADEADVQAVLDSLGDRADRPGFAEYAVNNSGNYPNENRIECDRETLRIMLQCAPCALWDTAVTALTAGIKARVLDKFEKTDDFQVIAEEYD